MNKDTIYGSLVFISADNVNRLEKIYGCRLYPNKLKDIVNRHLSTAIDEIEREGSIQRNEMAMIKLDEKYPNRSEKDFEES
jgi:hypothetical protein